MKKEDTFILDLRGFRDCVADLENKYGFQVLVLKFFQY
jgi:hypothetical protein